MAKEVLLCIEYKLSKRMSQTEMAVTRKSKQSFLICHTVKHSANMRERFWDKKTKNS